jgi:hypothetical protein
MRSINFTLKNKGYYLHAFFLLMMILTGVSSSSGQAASSTWALTANANASVSGSVSAGSQTSGSGISSVSYGSNGVNSLGWAATSQDANAYYQFTISPTAGKYLTVTSINTTNMMTSGGGTALIQYSYSPSFTSPLSVGSSFSVANSTATNTFNSLSIFADVGQTLYFRLFAWGAGNNSNKFFFCKNFIVSGTTATVVCPSAPSAGSNSPVCAGTNLNLSSSSSGAPLFYSWSGPNGFSSSLQNPTLSNATIAASGTYTVTVSNSCGSTASSSSVTINPAPATTATPASQSICSVTTSPTLFLEQVMAYPERLTVGPAIIQEL